MKDCLVLERFIDSKGNLHSKRLVHIEQSVPKPLRPFANRRAFFALEESRIDPKHKVFEMTTRNITYSSAVQANEVCIYKPCEADPTKTEYLWNLEVKTKRRVPLISGRIEKSLIRRAEKNAGKGIAIMRELSEQESEVEVPSNGVPKKGHRLLCVLSDLSANLPKQPST